MVGEGLLSFTVTGSNYVPKLDRTLSASSVITANESSSHRLSGAGTAFMLVGEAVKQHGRRKRHTDKQEQNKGNIVSARDQKARERTRTPLTHISIRNRKFHRCQLMSHFNGVFIES